MHGVEQLRGGEHVAPVVDDLTPDVQGGLVRHTVLKDARDWTQGSDHVPVCVELRV
jgi:hypothetical protein